MSFQAALDKCDDIIAGLAAINVEVETIKMVKTDPISFEEIWGWLFMLPALTLCAIVTVLSLLL